MDKKTTKILGYVVKCAEDGKDTFDVFDIVYETNILYPYLKPHLDELVKAGTLTAENVKTYRFTGDLRAERAKLNGAYAEKGGRSSKKKPAKQRAFFETEESPFIADSPLFRLDEKDDIFEEDVVEPDGEDFLEFYADDSVNFSTELEAVMVKAEELAKDSGCSYIGEEHLFYSLLICDGKAKRILNNCDVYAERYRLYYLRVITPAKNVNGLTPASKALSGKAVEFASDINGEGAPAGTEHLLLAILTQGEGKVERILNVMDADVPKILEELEKALCGNGE